MVGQWPLVGEDQRARHLLHEQGIRVWGGAKNLYPATRQVNDEQRVIGYEALGRPHFGGEEIRSGNGAPVGAQERLP